ncbi:MAG: GGDEF domain-containing protein [Pseudomonadota bacterium]
MAEASGKGDPVDYVEREQKYRLLDGQQLFRGASLDAVEYLFEAFEDVTFPADQIILERGRANRKLYLIIDGEVTVQLREETASPHYRLGAGECFGEMGLIDDGVASATVVAIADSRCLVIDEDTLWAMVHRSHCIARNLLFILTRRIRSANETVAANLEQLKRWEVFALSDALTGLKNRRWLDESMPALMTKARESGEPFALLVVDVDHFKAFNDRWGHLAGDEALRTVATVIRKHVRFDDLVARYGGEEFVILLPETTTFQAEQLAQRLCRAIASAPAGRHGGSDLPPVTVSMGLSALHLEDPDDQPLARADRALFDAKTAGRNGLAKR